MKALLFPLLAVVAALTACSHDAETYVADDPAPVQGGDDPLKGVTTDGVTWDTDAVVGISVWSTGGTTAGFNVPYRRNAANTAFEPQAAPLYFQDNESVTFCAYGPYSSTVTAVQPAIVFDTDDQTQQSSYDFVYARGATASKAGTSLSFDAASAFRHVMARMVVTFACGEGISDLTNLSVKLQGAYTQGSFDTFTGTLTPNVGVAADTAVPLASYASGTTRKSLPLILIPQKRSAPGDCRLVVTLDGENYTADVDLTEATGSPLTAGQNLNLQVTVHKTRLTLTATSIEPWTDAGTPESGTATL
ncbi:MAG: fimbrillin family protein [Alloprevotella sp.]